jgi:hypothetical protein
LYDGEFFAGLKPCAPTEKATAKADPCGMTNKGTCNGNNNGNGKSNNNGKANKSDGKKQKRRQRQMNGKATRRLK